MDVPPEVAPVRVAWGAAPEKVHKDLDNVGFDGDRLYAPIFTSADFQPFSGSVMDIDPSGRGSDETAYIVTKFLNGVVFIRRWGGFRDGHSEATLRRLAEIAKEEKVNLVRAEGNFGDGMFLRLLEPHLRAVGYPVATEDHKVSGQKEVRMMGLIRPALQQHRIVIDTTVVRDDLQSAKRAAQLLKGSDRGSSMETSGLYQLTHLTEARGALKHDDRLDVLAHALAYWSSRMNADAHEAELKLKEAQDREFERLIFQTQVIPVHSRRKTGRGRGRRR
ncbi:phage terminase large subunit [Sphingomonas sp. J344]|nr:phage terminase large subunit [Sphingomonas sp. J344]MCR5870667.1 phage terminase large subunit [Sphingomonas sp. J344]